VDIFITQQGAAKKEIFSRTLLLKNYLKSGDALFAERPKRVFSQLNDNKSTGPIMCPLVSKRNAQ